ncbi:hypothetical protein X975_17789, partial [Stegodyphus mimosarum]
MYAFCRLSVETRVQTTSISQNSLSPGFFIYGSTGCHFS